MGDRGNIAIEFENSEQPIYFYTHWSGYRLPQILADALDSPEGRGRWSDSAYLARIIFDRLTDGDRSGLGYGISTYISDNEHPILYVNMSEGTVRIGGEVSPKTGAVYTFEDFITKVKADTLSGWS